MRFFAQGDVGPCRMMPKRPVFFIIDFPDFGTSTSGSTVATRSGTDPSDPCQHVWILNIALHKDGYDDDACTLSAKAA